MTDAYSRGTIEKFAAESVRAYQGKCTFLRQILFPRWAAEAVKWIDARRRKKTAAAERGKQTAVRETGLKKVWDYSREE